MGVVSCIPLLYVGWSFRFKSSPSSLPRFGRHVKLLSPCLRGREDFSHNLASKINSFFTWFIYAISQSNTVFHQRCYHELSSQTSVSEVRDAIVALWVVIVWVPLGPDFVQLTTNGTGQYPAGGSGDENKASSMVHQCRVAEDGRQETRLAGSAPRPHQPPEHPPLHSNMIGPLFLILHNKCSTS